MFKNSDMEILWENAIKEKIYFKFYSKLILRISFESITFLRISNPTLKDFPLVCLPSQFFVTGK